MPRAPSCSPKVDLDMAKAFWIQHWEGEAQHVIAAAHQVNPGRVCEVLKGRKFPEAFGLSQESLID